MTAAEALLAGFVAAILLVAVIAFLFVLWRVDRRLAAIGAQVGELRPVLDSIRPLAQNMLRTTQAMNQTSEAIRGLSGLMTATPPAAPQPEWRHPVPPNPEFEIPAPPEEAGYIEQSDEDLAEQERILELREQGIEASPDRVPYPDFSQMRGE